MDWFCFWLGVLFEVVAFAGLYIYYKMGDTWCDSVADKIEDALEI